MTTFSQSSTKFTFRTYAVLESFFNVFRGYFFSGSEELWCKSLGSREAPDASPPPLTPAPRWLRPKLQLLWLQHHENNPINLASNHRGYFWHSYLDSSAKVPLTQTAGFMPPTPATPMTSLHLTRGKGEWGEGWGGGRPLTEPPPDLQIEIYLKKKHHRT